MIELKVTNKGETIMSDSWKIIEGHFKSIKGHFQN